MGDPIADLELDEMDGVPVARISGEIDISIAASLTSRLRAARVQEASGMVVDLTRVDYLDSSGLRLLLKTATSLEELKQKLHLVVGEGSVVERLLAMTRTDDILTVHRTVADAVRALTPAT